ncbi:MAG: TonB-dependent receptor [Bacteroidales bacterium]|jgi:TonB-linked SusC/RagA family outer membrane protein|nr:TonB-dependent receptor [Bacteroidales bacterium]
MSKGIYGKRGTLRKLLYTLCIVCTCTISLFAQQEVNLSGVVLDEKDEPLPGASILVKGSTRGVMTDPDGAFSIKVSPTDQLVVSFVGYEDFTLEVGAQTKVSITLSPKANELDEVTIVAFGKQKKESVVASVSTVKVSDLKVPSSNLTTAFAGRIAGLISVQTTGEPGADNADFFVRGVSSFEGGRSNPLILIDGFEATKDDLARLQPDDIESFSVMKDASASVLYGARGANGIIIVTTKPGTEGAPRISARVDVNVTTPTREKKVLDGPTYMRMYNEALISRNPESVPYYSEQKIQSTIRGDNPNIYPNVDWYDEMFNNATVNTKANINVSGGGGVATYYVSGGYDHDNGLLKTNQSNSFDNNISINRVHIRNNVILKLSSTTKLDTRIQGRFENYNGPYRSAKDIYYSVMLANPVDHPVIYEPDAARMHADHVLFGNTYDNNQYMKTNPYAQMVMGYEDRQENRISAQATLLQDLDFITEGLKLQLKGSAATWSKSSGLRFFTPFYYGLDSYNMVTGEHTLYCLNPTNTNNKLGDVIPSRDGDALYSGELRLNWERIFGVHSVGAMVVGTLSSKQLTSGNSTSIFEQLPEKNMGISGRATYGFDSRYFVEFAFGYNGSEKFSSDKAYGFFPSIGLGWLISNEPYWNVSKNIISNLKLKFTWGRVGNDALDGRGGRFFYLSQFNRGGGAYIFGEDFLNRYEGYSIARYPNADISWEVSNKYNLGLELGFLKDQAIKLQIDAFLDNRENIYELRQNYPHSAGLEVNIRTNSGRVRSKGIEAELDIQHNFTTDFWVTGRGNFTFAVNEILEKDEPNYRDDYRSQIGHSTTQKWGLVAERLFVDDQEVANSPKQYDGNYMAGDIKYKDVNGDGIINDEDQIPMGYPTSPQIQYGFGLSAGYKKFDLSFFFQGNARVSFFINSGTGGGTDGTEGIAPLVNRRNALEIVERDYWSETNPNVHAFWPRLSVRTLDNNTKQSSWWLRNNSFLRLKTVEFGYSVGSLPKIKISNLRFYFSGENFFVLSRFKLWDPEQGRNGLGYPLNRKYNIGLHVTF